MSDTASTGWAAPLLRLARIAEMKGVALRMPSPRSAAGRLSGFRLSATPLFWVLAARERAVDAAFSIGAIVTTGWRWFANRCGEVQICIVFMALLMLLAIAPKPGLPEFDAALRTTTDAEPLPPAYSRAPWQSVSPRLAALALDAPELGGAPLYRMRAAEAGQRHDLLVWPATDTRVVSGAMMVEKTAPSPGRADEALYVELARRMALTGASIEKLAHSTEGLSKFGPLEVADMQVYMDGRLKGCLGFRTLADAPLAFTGWFCGTASKPMDRAGLTCLVDRLDLVGAGNDMALRAWFAQVDQQRSACSGRGATALARQLTTATVQLKPSLPERAARVTERR